MDINKLIGESQEGVLPEQVAPLVQAIIEGRVKQMCLIVEMADGCFMDCYPILDDGCNRFAMVGAIEVLKRDYMRTHIQSRVNYVEQDEED